MMENVTFIYCFKDRDLERVKLSLDSLAAQRDQSFKVIFVDYGNDEIVSGKVRKLTGHYSFIRYIYNDTRCMMWNKSHALNTGIHCVDTDYIYTSDIDMIYDPGFTEVLNRLAEPDKAVFFAVKYLPQGKLPGSQEEEKNYQRSKDDALGLGLIPVKALRAINGYDEFYHIWGKEDNDIGLRLRVAGLKFVFIQEIWVRHYYHDPIPHQRKFFPDGWFFFVSNYYDHHSTEAIRNNNYEWGKILTPENRKSIEVLEKFPTGFLELRGRSHYFRYQLETRLDTANPGSILALTITDCISEEFQNARLQKVGSWLNNILQKVRAPFVLSTKYQHQYEDIYSYRDELFYFLVTNRNQISDYAFEISDKILKVVIVKK